MAQTWFSDEAWNSSDLYKFFVFIEVPGNYVSSQNDEVIHETSFTATFKISENLSHFPNIKLGSYCVIQSVSPSESEPPKRRKIETESSRRSIVEPMDIMNGSRISCPWVEVQLFYLNNRKAWRSIRSIVFLSLPDESFGSRVPST